MSKVEIKEVTTNEFKPFVLEITVESPEEAWNLWHRMNIHNTDVIERSDYLPQDEDLMEKVRFNMIAYDIWDILNDEMIKQKLKD